MLNPQDQDAGQGLRHKEIAGRSGDGASEGSGPHGHRGSGPGTIEEAHVLGEVRPDGDGAHNLSTPVTVSDAGRQHFRRDLYVSIDDRAQGIEFLGRVVEGPFYESEGDGRANGHASNEGIRGLIEIMGQLNGGVQLRPTATRPRPGSVVHAFPGSRLKNLLGIEGDFYLGRLIGADATPVYLKSDSKNFLPRNVGIFGTVGSGKSNTMQVLMEEAVRAGWAVIAIDVEGEYVRMSHPTEDQTMAALLERDHGLGPAGIDDFHVYVPAAGRSGAAESRPFKVPISALQPEIIADILEFSEAHMRMFEAATRNAGSRNEYLNRQTTPQPAATARPAAPTASHSRLPGAPPPALQSSEESARSRLPGAPPQLRQEVVPEAEAVDAPQSSAEPAPLPSDRIYSLQDLIDGLQESNQSVPLIPRIRSEDLPTAASLRARLVHLGRSDVLDWSGTAHIPELPIEDMMVGGRLSVVDVSESDDRSRNIAIAYTLQALFERVVATPIGETMPSGRPRPPVLVVIEEVHTFVSRATAHRMRAVLDQLQVISRRGRKRWMSLALVSQQPNHVPDELFELANTRFVHQMKSVTNLNAVKKTTGGVHDALWSTISTLGPGQCLITGAVLKNALLLNVRPARSQRQLAN